MKMFYTLLGFTLFCSLCITFMTYAEGLFLLAVLLFLPMAMVLSLLGALKKQRLLFSLLLICQSILWIPSFYYIYSESIVSRITCNCHMIYLREALLEYAHTHDGKLPPPDAWCARICEEKDASKIFCKKEQLCHYALNGNCTLNSPKETVLLFEIKGGWNLYGGKERLTSRDNYQKGWRIITLGGRVDFIEPRRLDKLIW